VVISWEHCRTETSLESKTTLVMNTWCVCVSWLSCTFQGGVQPNVVPPEFKASEYDICYWNFLWKKSRISVSLFYLLILSDKLYNHSTEPSLWPTQLYGTVYQQQLMKLTACICLGAGSNNCHFFTYLLCRFDSNRWAFLLIILFGKIMNLPLLFAGTLFVEK